MAQPLSSLSPSKQNSRLSPTKQDFSKTFDSAHFSQPETMYYAPVPEVVSQPLFHNDDDQFHDAYSIAPGSPSANSTIRATPSPTKSKSPVKYRLNDSIISPSRSPRDSPRDETPRVNANMKQASMNDEMSVENEQASSDRQIGNTFSEDNETDLTTGFEDRTFAEDTIGDLSTISAIPADLTRFANLCPSPTKRLGEQWSPSKQLNSSAISSTPALSRHHSQSASQRPLHLVSRQSHSSAEGDDERTPRRPQSFYDSPTDLLNFTGQSNILIPPPGSAPRTTRRSPSGRGAFPIRVNPSPTHRSQASVDRERAGNSPQKSTMSMSDRTVPATPSEERRSYFGTKAFGPDLLDLEIEPLATPRSVPTVTPRELETLRSELQSRISGLEATLSGKEAEVQALKHAVTDAEVRVGNTSQELRTERAAREDLERERAELERRSREMEGVLREVKQNAFVEEREREKLRKEVADSERKMEDAEIKILELTASLDTLREDRMKASPSPIKPSDPSTPGTLGGVIDVDTAVKQATESVARELHALYKGKHERKVADLKVSYEKRWMRKVEGLEADLKKSQEDMLKLQTERDATMSGVIPGMAEREKEQQRLQTELLEKTEKSEAEKTMLQAQVAGLEGQIGTLRAESYGLRKEVEQERIEKGELVAQVDLFLTMSEQEKEAVRKPLPESPSAAQDLDQGQSFFDQQSATQSPSKVSKRMSFAGNPLVPGSGTAGSKQRPMSMLKPPGGGKFSGIPGPGALGVKSGAGSSNKYGGGYGARGGIMEGITRMGAGR